MNVVAAASDTSADRRMETGLSLLARRNPLLFSDLRQWLGGSDRSVTAEPAHGPAIEFTQDRYRYIAQVTDPSRLTRELEHLPDAAQLVHLLHSPAALLQMLGRNDMHRVLQHDAYVPLLLLPINNAPHLKQWLAALPPRHWPWSIDSTVRHGPAREHALRLSSELRALLQHLYAALLSNLTNGPYAQRPTPDAVLRDAKCSLRVLVPASSSSAYQQFCARDMCDGLTSPGVDCRVDIIDQTPTARYELLQTIEQFDPDVLILNGLTRPMFGELPEQLTIITWDQDYVACADPAHAELLGPRDVLALMVEDWRDDAIANRAPAKQVHYLNLGTNTRLFQPPAAPKQQTYDVLFVGNYHPFDRYRPLISFDKLQSHIQRLMLAARERLDDWISTREADESFVIPDCEALLIETQKQLAPNATLDPAHLRPLTRYFRYRIAHMLVRERYIESLTEFNLGLFGNGWDALPAVCEQQVGVIENGEPLRNAIHESAIVLHLHTWTVHHPRLYDSAAAGGFLLVGRVPERNPLQSVFEPEHELDSFGSIAEMKQKIRWWLDHPDQRHQCAAAAAERAANEHAMTDRMSQLLHMLRDQDHDS